MHFLIDASLPRSSAPLVQSHGHLATDVHAIGLGSAADQDIAAYAQTNQLAIMPRDFDFADVPNYPPDQYAGFAVISLPSSATAPTILNVVDALLRQAQTLNHLPGRLAIVEAGRIRLRPAP
ncbi:MAG TPA: DUF5615 family PIN-like protein [Gemmataceae bacterium]|nr:DUF5615 family PIN-like protein [Gemmataceae bacterium]